MLHVDVMDGAFVPNISLGVPVLAALAKRVPAFYAVSYTHLNIPGSAIGLAMITVVGQCVGAKDYQQARHYTCLLYTSRCV